MDFQTVADTQPSVLYNVRVCLCLYVQVNKLSDGKAIRRNKKDGGCRFYHNALRT